MRLPLESIDAFNINCVGSWNPAIFTPEWVKENIASDGTQEVIMAVQMDKLNSSPPRISVDAVHLYPSRQNLIIDSHEFDDNTVALCVEKLKVVAKLLPHTPITDLGFNFRYICDLGENQNITDLFTFGDAAKIDSNTFKRKTSSLNRKFEMDGKSDLNLLIDTTEVEIKFTFNFNLSLKKLSDVLDVINADYVSSLQKQSKDFLSSAYDLTLEE